MGLRRGDIMATADVDGEEAGLGKIARDRGKIESRQRRQKERSRQGEKGLRM
jgi:hypothetical protein